MIPEFEGMGAASVEDAMRSKLARSPVKLSESNISKKRAGRGRWERQSVMKMKKTKKAQP